MQENILMSKIRVQSPNLRKTKIMNRNYLIYIGTRPGSHGLFGNIEEKKLADINALGKEMYEISGEKTVYKGIISLSGNDAKNLGYITKEKWEEYLNFVMPDKHL